MGNCNCNCIEFAKSVSWVDDGEWDIAEPEYLEDKKKMKSKKKTIKREEESKREKENEIIMAPKAVKIKISKKQLDELLNKVDSKDLPMQDLLAGIVKIGKPCQTVPERERYWRPALQSIPELPEQ